MIVLLELLTVLLEYIDLFVMISTNSYYYTNILPIMLALCSMLSDTYYAHNYASIIRGSLFFTIYLLLLYIYIHGEALLFNFFVISIYLFAVLTQLLINTLDEKLYIVCNVYEIHWCDFSSFTSLLMSFSFDNLGAVFIEYCCMLKVSVNGCHV